jgi:hypothetical protein
MISDGAAWLTGKPARAVACDAAVIPVVTGGIDPAALDDLVTLCLQYAGHGSRCGPGHGAPRSGPAPAGQAGDPDPDGPTGPPRDRFGSGRPEDPPGGGHTCPTGPRPPAAEALEMLRHAIIGTAVDLVSGPGGLASFLRTRLLGARLAGPSLPLDVGHSAEIPAAIRRAVILRDQHCRWAGGCDQPAAACEVHHLTHLADGGTTSVAGCG